MDRECGWSNFAVFIAGATVVASIAVVAGFQGWNIPPGAAAEKSPIVATVDVLQTGKTLFTSKCQRCHGPEGKGNGPDADADSPPEDLSDAARARLNPDGVMFYRVWNGHRSLPKMPAFKDELTTEQVWTVIAYAKTLRRSGIR